MKERIGKYLEAELELRAIGRKTDRWIILSSGGDTLGSVKWFTGWRQYIFQPSWGTEFNSSCLTDIARFLDKQNQVHKNKKETAG